MVAGPDSDLWMTEPLDSTYGARLNGYYSYCVTARSHSSRLPKDRHTSASGTIKSMWLTKIDLSPERTRSGRLTTKEIMTQFAVEQ